MTTNANGILFALMNCINEIINISFDTSIFQLLFILAVWLQLFFI